MDNNVDLPFDFKLHFEKRSGLFIELSPGDSVPDSQSWVSVDERAFGFVEMFLKGRISNRVSYSHYGVNKIQCEEWIKSLNDLDEYCRELEIRPSYDDRRWVEGGYAEIHGEFFHAFEKTRNGVRNLAEQLRIWTDSWSESYPNIFIYGI